MTLNELRKIMMDYGLSGIEDVEDYWVCSHFSDRYLFDDDFKEYVLKLPPETCLSISEFILSSVKEGDYSWLQ